MNFLVFVLCTARRIFRQAVEGLLYLHSHKILHRDLSLANLLLTNTMDAVSTSLSPPPPHTHTHYTFSLLQKIGDFGLAAQLKAADEKHYTMCGTPNYIAPWVFTFSVDHFTHID